MIITIVSFNLIPFRKMKLTSQSAKKGFSLAEVVVAVTISAFVLTSSYAAIISLAKGSESMTNYTEMNSKSRFTLETFGRDMRMAKAVKDFNPNNADHNTRITILRDVWDNATSDYIERYITDEYLPSAGVFQRVVNAVAVAANGSQSIGSEVKREILLFDVINLDIQYFNLVNNTNANVSALSVKHVQISATLQRSVLGFKNTNYIISARFMMRNKRVAV